jgi:FAD/FMN-containing dehydrogenase
VVEPNHQRYKTLQNSYWSGYQKSLKPRCFFQPHNAEELSRAVALCARGRCHFGVKSGGHGHFAGQSSIEGGIQLDLVKLKTVQIKRSEGTVIVGPGNTWGAVYEELQKEGLMVVGGRSANVGVGGYLVGGTQLPVSFRRWCLLLTFHRWHIFLRRATRLGYRQCTLFRDCAW